MATMMYKDEKFKMVRGMDAKAHLDDGWTFEPSKPKTTLRPRRTRKTLKVKDVEINKNDPIEVMDQDIEEINNGN